MATVNINEILGSDSISGSRVTLNSNFLILQNWINGYISVFGIDTTNGILNLSGASTGSVIAKIGRFDSLSLPSTGTAKTSFNSIGGGSFVDIQTTTFTASGSVVLNGAITLGTGSALVAGGTSTFNGELNANGKFNFGPQGHVVSQNTTYASGTAGTPFPVSLNSSGGGIVTSVNSPYAVTGLEDVIYASCGATASGFFMKVCDGVGAGATLPAIPQGKRITIVSTSGFSSGRIYTGVTGTTSTYYTGFNTDINYGRYPTAGLAVSSNKPYKASVTLQWEQRIASGQAEQNGSWVVLSAVNMTV
jgi:hypothetical protein